MITDFPLDFATFKKTWRPNQCLALPRGFMAAQAADIESPILQASEAQVHAAWLAVIAAQPRTRSLREQGNQVEVVQTTALMRFPDTITMRTINLGDGTTSIGVFSRSRYGIRDFGVNAARVRDWVQALQVALNSGS
jgi:uncharacterized protein (DUF1499 family)